MAEGFDYKGNLFKYLNNQNTGMSVDTAIETSNGIAKDLYIDSGEEETLFSIEEGTALDFDEFCEGFRNHSEFSEIDDEELKFLFDVLNADGNAELSYDELKHITQKGAGKKITNMSLWYNIAHVASKDSMAEYQENHNFINLQDKFADNPLNIDVYNDVYGENAADKVPSGIVDVKIKKLSEKQLDDIAQKIVDGVVSIDLYKDYIDSDSYDALEQRIKDIQEGKNKPSSEAGKAEENGEAGKTEENGESGKAEENGEAGKAEGNGEAGKAEGNGEAGKAEGNGEAGKTEGNGEAGKAEGNGEAGKAEGNGESGKAEGNGEAGKAEGNGEAGKAEGNGEAGETGNPEQSPNQQVEQNQSKFMDPNVTYKMIETFQDKGSTPKEVADWLLKNGAITQDDYDAMKLHYYEFSEKQHDQLKILLSQGIPLEEALKQLDAEAYSKFDKPFEEKVISEEKALIYAQELYNSTALQLGTDEKQIENILNDPNLSSADIVQIMKVYVNNFGSLVQHLDKDLSGSRKDNVMDALTTKLIEEAKAGNEDAINILALEFKNGTAGMNGTADEFIEGIFEKADDELLAKIAMRYSQINDGASIIDAIKDDFSWGTEDKYLERIMHAISSSKE